MKRMWIGTVVAAMAGWGLTGVPPVAEAKPATVDYVVTTIERNVAAGKWSLVAKNIEDLERTIRNEVTIRRSTVRLTGNPLQARLDAVQRRLDEIKSVYQPIYDTYVSLTEQAKAAQGAANAAIREELVSRIQATLERDLGNTLDTSTATKIVTEVKRMRDLDALASYLWSQLNGLAKAAKEAEAERDQLIPLNRAFLAVVEKFRSNGVTIATTVAPTPKSGAGASSAPSGTGPGWAVVAINDFNTTLSPRDAQWYRLSYARGSIGWRWALNSDAFAYTATWTAPPRVIRAGDKVSLTIGVNVTENVGSQYSANGSFSVFFDSADVEPGSAVSPIGLRSAGGEGSSVDVTHASKGAQSVSRTVSVSGAELRPGSKPGARMALIVSAYLGLNAGTRYVYEWQTNPAPITDPSLATPAAAGTSATPGTSAVPATTAAAGAVRVGGTTGASSVYQQGTRGDVFAGGHWNGNQSSSDWLQRDFDRPYLVSQIAIGVAGTDITTQGARLVLKLRRPDGTWVTVDDLAETNINMSVVTGGGAVNSMPSYRKAVTPAVLATAFRLEFTGNGWFVADSIDVVGTPS